MSPDGSVWTQAETWSPAQGMFLSLSSPSRLRTARIQAWLRSTRSKAARHPWTGGGGTTWEDSDFIGLSPRSPFCPLLSSIDSAPICSIQRSQDRLPPDWHLEAESQSGSSQGFKDSPSSRKEKILCRTADTWRPQVIGEVIGGDWRRLAFCRGESHRGHCGYDTTVFWLNLLALTPDLGSALVRPPLLTSTMDHHDQEPHKESITTTWAHRALTSKTKGEIRDVAERLRVRKLFGICEGWDWLPVSCGAGRRLCQWGSPCVCVP